MKESSTPQTVSKTSSMRPQGSQHGDPEGDDETVIVYNDVSNVEQSWQFSQFSASQSQDHQSLAATTSSQTDRQQQSEEEEAVSTLVSRKRQHKNFGRRSRYLQRRKVPPIGDNNIQYENGIHNEIDDFAFLRSKIDLLSPGQKRSLSQEQNLEEDDEANAKVQRQTGIRGEESNATTFQNSRNETTESPSLVKKTTLVGSGTQNMQLSDPRDAENPSMQKSVQTNHSRNIGFRATAIQNSTKDSRGSTDNILCSPPDFDLCASDGDDDEYSHDGDGNNEKINRSSNPLSIPSRLRTRHQNPQYVDSGKNKSLSYKDDVDYGNDTSRGMNGHKRRFAADGTQYFENKKLSSKKSMRRRSFNSGDSPKRTSGSSSSAAAAANSSTKHRKRKRPDILGRRGFASSLNSDKTKQGQLSQPSQAATNVENVKSIVGLRPTHWHRGTRIVRNGTTERKPLRQLAKKSALAAATRFSFNKMPNRPSKHTKSTSVKKVENSGHGNNDRSPIGKKDEEEIHSAKKPSSTETSKSSFSFVPSFVSTKSSALAQDPIGDDSGDDCRVVTTPLNHSFASTPPFKRRRRSKAANGEWVRRLVSLRNAHSNDSVRLQNKTFSRHRMLLDVSDPRRRAKTFTDVTILGQYIGPWVNVPEDMKVTVLGYAHCHTQRINNRIDNDRNTAQTKKQKDARMVSKGFYAWFTFTIATARRIELQQGCKLRIYNAVILPCRLPVILDAPPPSILSPDDEIGKNCTVSCGKTVICTQLCERIDSFN